MTYLRGLDDPTPDKNLEKIRSLENKKAWKNWSFLIKAAVSISLITFLAINLDFNSVQDQLLSVSPYLLIASGLFYTLQVLLAALRWKIVLSGLNTPLSLKHAFVFTFIGAFFNQTLPTSIGGDAFKIFFAYKSGINLKTSVNSVVLERVTTALTLVILVLFTLPFFLPRVAPQTANIFMTGIVLVAVGSVAGVALLATMDKFPKRLVKWRMFQALVAFSLDTRRIFLTPKCLTLLTIWGVVAHINLVLVAYLIILALGIHASFIDCLVLVPLVIMTTILPISIAGWGVREGAMIAAFSLIGIPAEQSLMLSVIFGLMGVVTAIPGGALWVLGLENSDTKGF